MDIRRLYVVVSMSGASVLALEILGTRILGPFYGVSLFLWSALITVTLAALSVGYLLGGHWADKGATFSRLYALLILAGLWFILIPWIKYPVLLLLEPFGLRVAVLFASVILFFIPLALLGMVSPYALKLKTHNLGEVGRSAGTLYAVSTLASVASALFTGFLLIPNFGVRFLTMSIGLVLIFTGSVGITVHKKSAIGTVAIVLLCAAGFYDFQKISYSSVDRERGLLAIEQSAYAEIRVIEKEGYRYLLIDGGVHSICDTDSSASVYPYVEVMDLPKYFFEEAGDMLLIGLGGGSLVTNYVQNGWTVDAVEIDSVVSRVAFQYFDLDPASFRLFHMDGRQYLTNTNRRYDVLLMDAFGSGAVPFHLATRDYFQLIKTRLKDGGILAINIESVGWKSRIIAALAKTLQQAFAHVMVLPVAEPPDALGNLILLATESNAALVTALEGNNRSIRQKFQENYAQVHAWDNRFFPEINDVPTITDDFNPIELWSESVNYAARKDLHRFFGSAKLSW